MALIRPQKKAVVLHLKDPDRVANLIPRHQWITYKGRRLIVVPHTTDAVKLLANLGIAIPDPVAYYYDFGPLTPFAAQKETVSFLTRHNRAYCLNDLGTGKTVSALWAFDYLKKERRASKLLVVAPLSTLERTWADEIFKNLPHLTCNVLHGSRERRRKLLAMDRDIYVINHDGIKIMLEDLLARPDIDTLVIDELSQVARNAGTRRWKALAKLVKGRARVWGMTGTPIPNEPTDAWAQCRLITPETVPAYYSGFRDLVMRQVTTFKWVPRDDALDTVHRVMQPAVRFKRSDCLDLPPVMYETRHADLTPEQTAMFKEMLATLYTEYRGQGISAVNEAVKMGKLVQICAGAAIGTDGVVTTLPTPRLQVLAEVIEEAAAKVIVFVPYRAPLDMLAEELGKRYSVGIIHGGVSKSERDSTLGLFQKTKHPQVLVAQPAAMSHGLNLTAANVIVWFAPVTSAETYEQANGRITRPGQQNNQLIIHLEGTNLEHRMYERLRHKVDVQGLLLDMFRNGVKGLT